MINKIHEKFSDCNIVYKGSIVLYYPDDALRIIDECKKINMKILGIDAFLLQHNGIQPFMEFSTDYSDCTIQETHKMAGEHIKSNCDRGLVFEIVI